MGGISMAVKFRHKETGLDCSFAGQRDYPLQEEIMTNLEKKVFLGKGICLSEEESTKAQLKIRNGIGLVRNMQMNLK